MIKNYALLLGALLLYSSISFGQKNLWQNTAAPSSNNRQIVPDDYRTVSVDFENLKTILQQAPDEKTISAANSNFIFTLPAPDGTNWLFRVVHSSIMETELQAQFPDIRTFLGQGVGDKAHATLRMDFGPKGFHAQVLTPEGSFFIDPYAPGQLETYICYTRASFYKNTNKQFQGCQTVGSTEIEEERILEEKIQDEKKGKKPTTFPLKATNGTNLRTYRLALACTGEYAQFHGGTTSLALAAMVTSMNRVNGVFERDMSLRMILVANNSQVIFLNAATDPYANTSGDLNANQTTCDNIIGSANYDIGHLFGTGGGGVAQLNSPCTSSKARGLTGSGSPVGDPFDIDYVAHEMGHQWGANHTQNNNCNRASTAAYEPGSASTIMGYAGICPPNLQSNSDDHFHNRSFNEMYTFSVTGNGNTCPVTTSTGNTPPTLTMPAGGFTIPVGTPFELTASATDPNGDLLTYCWEQYNLGPATATGDNNLTNPSGTAPIFRSWSPTTTPTRVFPRISDLVNNTTVIGELLPTYTRNLTFRCTVRDNRAGGGGVTDGQVSFEATSTAGPFIVTAPNTAVIWTGNSTQNVTWNVANTTATPVSCTNVDIYLSTDGGFNYPTLVASNVPNNGSASILVPNIATTQARIKVKAANNIFFDISNQNFTIQPGITSNYDASLNNISSPSGNVCGTSFTPQITIQNLGTITLTSLTILYNVDGATNQTFNWTGSLPSAATTNVVLPLVNTTSGNHVFNVTLQSPNGQTDQNNSNNSGSSAFTIITISPVSLPVTNNFSGSFPGTGWSVANPDGSITWNQQTLTNDGNCASGQSARMDFYSYNVIGQIDDIVTPWLNLIGTSNPQLSFSRAHARYDNTYSDRMQIQITTDCGASWVTLWDKAGSDLATAPNQTAAYNNPTCAQWVTESINLSAYSGQAVQIRFRAINGYGNNLFIDNINISEPCAATLWYQDLDGDTYGNPNVSQLACNQPPGYVANNTDCNDGNANVNPGVSEIACNTLDDNCNGQTDENSVFGCTNPSSCNFNPLANCDDGSCTFLNTWYQDADGDTYGNSSVSQLACSQPLGYVSNNTDCNDNNANVNPGAAELPCNTIDDNCSGQIDENGTYGCTNPLACNYNPTANCDDGSCQVPEYFETFTDGNFNDNPVWTGDVANWSIVSNASAGSNSTGSQTLRLNVASGSGTQHLRTPFTNWQNEQEWSFWLGRRSTAYSSTNSVAIWLYADQSNLESATINGYRIFIGDNSGGDEIFLQRVINGTPTNIVNSAAITNGLTDISKHIRITRNYNGVWTLYTSVLPTTNGQGPTANECINAAILHGSATDNTYIPSATAYIGIVVIHDSQANPRSNVEFDQISITSNSVVQGCTNPVACNYNPNALLNDGSCDLVSCFDCNGVANGTAFLDNCGTCVGGTTGLNPCVADCNGTFGGTAFLDNCNTCVGGNTGLSACAADCNGVFGGTAFTDNCGTCVGGNTGLSACAADCNGVFGGTAFFDNCNTCVGGNTGLSACAADCNGVFGGTAFLDNCNTCVGGNTGLSACAADCNGVFGGTAFFDNCNTCVGGNTGLIACLADCNGVFGGTAFFDNCNTCVGGNTGLSACAADCNGVFGGTAFFDNCNTCVGGNTGLSACAADCNGVFGGTAFFDNCNTCVGGNTGLSACVADCNGVFGGTAFFDNCNTCVGGNTGLSACTADCNGVFGGTAFFDNCNTCVGGNTGLSACAADCNGVFGGTAFFDNCNTCVGGNTGLSACVADCNGVFGGTAFLDNCNTCVGGNTGLSACAADCNGVFGGTAFFDNCNTCVGGNTGLSACAADCNGVFGGTAFLDNCNTCVGGNTGLSACAADCNGVFGGTAFFDNCNTCVGGNTGLSACVADCNGVFGGTAFIGECGLCIGGNTGINSCPTECNLTLSTSSTNATLGFANGSATVVASGGTPPYSYQWNDSFEQTTATALGIFPGTYTCIVTDANNCTASIQVTVSLQTNVPLTQVKTQFCNTGGYILSDVISCDVVPGASNYRWQLTPQGGSPLPEYTRGSSNTNLRLSWVTGAQLGVTYEVRVRAFVNGQWGAYGPMCTITTTSIVPLTEVHPNYTPNNPNTSSSYVMCGILRATTILGAAIYEWEFSGPSFHLAQTSSYNLPLSSVSGLLLNNTYQVRVRVQVSGIWGVFGPARPVNLGLPAVTSIWVSHCNTTRTFSQNVAAFNVCGGPYYFRFQHASEPERIVVRPSYTCGLNQPSPALTPGQTYLVSVRVSQGGVDGAYGTACPITIAAPGAEGFYANSAISKVMQSGAMSLYPNPNFGGEVNLMLPEIEEGAHEISIAVYDIYGKRISLESFGYEGSDLNHILRFNNALSTGIYTVHVIIDGNSFAVERMVVN
jgi:hypothetical protein